MGILLLRWSGERRLRATRTAAPPAADAAQSCALTVSETQSRLAHSAENPVASPPRSISSSQHGSARVLASRDRDRDRFGDDGHTRVAVARAAVADRHGHGSSGRARVRTDGATSAAALAAVAVVDGARARERVRGGGDSGGGSNRVVSGGRVMGGVTRWSG